MGYALAIIGIAISIVALYLSIRALQLSITQSKSLENQQNRLLEIYDSLSTRYLGEFPDYYNEIVNILEYSQKSIQIVTDIPAYGHFSRYSTWVDYSSILKKYIPQDDVTVEIMCLNEKHRAEQLKKQFLQDKRWNQWVRTPDGKRLLEEFCKRRDLPSIKKYATDNFQDEFHRALAEEDLQALKDFAGADILKELPIRVPLHFWIIDGKDAIFEFPTFVDGYSTHGFRTMDRSIIRSLQNTFEEYKSLTIE